MKKSCFKEYEGDKGVCIALKHPNWFFGKCYKPLFPKWYFLSKYFKDHDKEAYTEAYYDQVLSRLDPQKVWDDLKDSVILCWEKPGKFCHRNIVAEWLHDQLGVDVPEI